MCIYIHFEGQTKNVRTFARLYNIPYNTLLRRLERGWSIERALTEPVNKGCLTYKKQKISYRKGAKIAGITPRALFHRIHFLGMSVEDAIEMEKYFDR